MQFLLALVCGRSSAGFQGDADNAGRQPAAGFQFRPAASVSFMFSAAACKAEFKGFSEQPWLPDSKGRKSTAAKARKPAGFPSASASTCEGEKGVSRSEMR